MHPTEARGHHEAHQTGVSVKVSLNIFAHSDTLQNEPFAGPLHQRRMYSRERPVLSRTIAMGHWLLSLMELGRRRLASLSALPLVEQASRCWAVCGGLLFLPVCVSPLNAMIPFMGIVQSVVVREAVSPDGTDVRPSLKTLYRKCRLARQIPRSLARAPVLAAVHE
jgi:hypothetical protein